jgi:hypothetical protein
MKAQATAIAVRATMSPTECSEIVTLARDAERLGLHLSPRLMDMIALLDCTAHSVRMRQASKRAERKLADDAERRRRDREEYFMIDDFSVMASRADYADVSRDPDFRLWVDVILQECLNKPLPDQCEIRRDVWLVRVVQLIPGQPLGGIVGHDCTKTAERREIGAVARRLIARHPQQAVPA